MPPGIAGRRRDTGAGWRSIGYSHRKPSPSGCFTSRCTFGVFPFLLYRKLLPLLSVAALVAGIGYGAYTLYIPEFIESQLTRSTLFEEAYVDPRSITLTFPEEKRNLVYIYLESMESTYLSKELGGNQEENLLPNLSELALTNLNFSHTDTLGGAGR